MSGSLKWGLITGVVYIIFSLISKMLGLEQSAGSGGMTATVMGLLVNTILMVVTFFTLYLGLKEIRDNEMEGYLTMGQAVRIVMKMALIAGLMVAAYTLLYGLVIDPNMMEKSMEAVEAQWDKANMPEEQREMSRKIVSIFLHPLILAPIALIYICFWGLLKSLVAGAILKKEAPPSIPPSMHTAE